MRGFVWDRWMTASILGVLLSACPDPPETSSPILRVAGAPAVFNASAEVQLTIEAIDESGQPGTGSVSIEADRGSLNGGGVSLEVELTAGRASARYACDVATDRSCVGQQSLRVEWRGVARPLNLCARTTCALMGRDCAEISDQCNGTLDCGVCSYPLLCGVNGTSNVCETPPFERICSDAGLCWEHPLPQGQQLRVVSGSGPRDVWAATWQGMFLHWDGTRWAPRLSPAPYRAVVAIRSDGVGAARAVSEDSRVLTWDGVAWTGGGALPSTLLNSAWLGADGGAWGVTCGGGDGVACAAPSFICPDGLAGRTLRWEGSSWLEVANPFAGRKELLTVFGISDQDVWAAGLCGALAHWDGRAWSEIPGVSNWFYSGLWGASSDNVWASGQRPIIHWNGSAWAEQFAEATYSFVWGSGPTDVWAITGDEGVDRTVRYPGYVVGHFDGGTWARIDTKLPGSPRAMWGSSSSDLWVVGDRGLISHVQGGQWSSLSLIAEGEPVTYGACSFGGGKLVAVGGSVAHASGTLSAAVIRRGADRLWSTVEPSWEKPATYPIGVLRSVACLAPDLIIALGDHGILEGAGSTWRVVRFAPVFENSLSKVWGSSAADVWAVGSDNTHLGRVLKRDATGWRDVQIPAVGTLHSVHGTASDDVWAVGEDGKVVHFDGATWSLVDTGVLEDFYDVLAISRNDVWIVGRNALTLHWNGAAWTRVPNPATSFYSLQAVAATGPSDVWAVGNGIIMSWNGSTWTILDSQVTSGIGFTDAVGERDGGIWLVGEGAEILARPE